jgi:hypothetical protein
MISTFKKVHENGKSKDCVNSRNMLEKFFSLREILHNREERRNKRADWSVFEYRTCSTGTKWPQWEFGYVRHRTLQLWRGMAWYNWLDVTLVYNGHCASPPCLDLRLGIIGSLVESQSWRHEWERRGDDKRFRTRAHLLKNIIIIPGVLWPLHNTPYNTLEYAVYFLILRIIWLIRELVCTVRSEFRIGLGLRLPPKRIFIIDDPSHIYFGVLLSTGNYRKLNPTSKW